MGHACVGAVGAAITEFISAVLAQSVQMLCADSSLARILDCVQQSLLQPYLRNVHSVTETIVQAFEAISLYNVPGADTILPTGMIWD